MCVQDIFSSLSLIPKHSSPGCVLWGGAGTAVFLRPKLNIVTFLDFLDLFIFFFMLKAGWWERQGARSIAEARGKIFGQGGQWYLKATRRHRLEKGGALMLGCLATCKNKTWGHRVGTQEAAPGRWCDLSQRARDIRHRGPHTTRGWGFSWHLCPSCSPYSALSHSSPGIRPALCAVIVVLALEQFPLSNTQGAGVRSWSVVCWRAAGGPQCGQARVSEE